MYLLLMVLFMPFLFYTDFVKATADTIVDIEPNQTDTGRILHKFPLEKVNVLDTNFLPTILIS